MTYNEKKQYLSQYLEIQRSIQGLTSECQRWRDIAERINQQYSATPGSGGDGTSKIEKSVVAMSDIIEDISAEMEIAKTKREEILNTINKHSPKKRYAELLKMKYIYGMSTTRIAYKLDKDYKTITNAICNAIRSLDI